VSQNSGTIENTSISTSSGVLVEDYISWASGYSIKDIHDLQRSDPDIGPVCRWKLEGRQPSGDILSVSSMATRHYVLNWDTLVIVEGMLFRRFDREDGTGSFWQLVVPRCLQKVVLYQMHHSLLSVLGHMGLKETKEKVLQKYYWYGIREDIDLWILKCETCGASKSTAQTALEGVPTGGILDRLCTDQPSQWYVFYSYALQRKNERKKYRSIEISIDYRWFL